MPNGVLCLTQRRKVSQSLRSLRSLRETIFTQNPLNTQKVFLHDSPKIFSLI